MTKSLMTLMAGAAMLISSGCATKNYVRKEMSPTVNKINELDEMTAKNTNDIRDVDARATKGISDVNTKASEVDQKAQAAGQKATEAQTLASAANSKADVISNVVANLDNYRPVTEASVHFAFNSDVLTKRAKEALDQLAQEIPNTKGYIIELIGGTDSTGDPQYNYELSQRRAAAVTQYLAANHGVPAHKVYVIGLGEDKKAASNSSAAGRAKNRRVDVRLMTNIQENETPGANSPSGGK
jgi:outer membrane protein OmpA-like peptidoglycan-associated protein